LYACINITSSAVCVTENSSLELIKEEELEKTEIRRTSGSIERMTRKCENLVAH